MKTWPTLYKKTSTGATQYWKILTKLNTVGQEGIVGGGRIETEFGQLDTDKPQFTFDVIEEGKNIGKKNETTPYEQAESEAQSKWEKQKKKGYVETAHGAQAGEVDDLIEGGINPMLAHKFTDHAHKIVYPAFVQPKLDGIRCIAIVRNGKVTLWSRTRKPITSMPHIVAQLEKLNVDIVLDGELYNHAFKANFEHIVSLVRQEKPDPKHTDVQYHVYDIVNEEPFSKRAVKLRYLKERYFDGSIVKVETRQVEDEAQTMNAFEEWRADGYEGAMIRNADSTYEYKRSYSLQKIKEFDSEEYKIVGVDEGRGKLAGHVGAFICVTKSGKQFMAKMSGSTEMLKKYFEDHSTWTGKELTVKFQGLTGKESVPRFPVGVTIRDYE